MKKIFFLLSLMIASTALARNNYVRGMNLTETDGQLYDASTGSDKTSAQLAVDAMKAIGVTHVVLNPRAIMTNPRSNDVIPHTPVGDRANERNRYLRLIQYIHTQGMTVGVRPIFFVVDQSGNVPFYDQNGKIWWHGNIQPADPNRWFDSFQSYLDIYLLIAKLSRAEEFTIGAELYSMTVGIEDQWKEYPYGFPAQWLALLNYSRGKLATNCRVMYDINFTDSSVSVGGGAKKMGGELERWRYRLVDLANPKNPAENKIWQELVQFWTSLDAVGIDMYRSLASKDDVIPADYNKLVDLLSQRANEYASQLDTTFVEIEATLNVHKNIIFKEVGYRSTTKGFINPFVYDNPAADVNLFHQAAAYEAFFKAFWAPNWNWFQGVSFWDVGVNPSRQGIKDSGFSPIAKPPTETVVKNYYLN